MQQNVETVAGLLFAALVALLVAELGLLHFRGRRLRLREARTALLGLGSGIATSTFFGRFVGPVSVAAFAAMGARVAPVESLGLGWSAWIWGWLVYEFWYWVQHWAAHKVRLLWCIHSPHHAPGSIHLLIGANHHLLESAFYMPFFAGFAPALLGVDPLICIVLNIVDGLWGSGLHVGEGLAASGRYGPLHAFLQTPSYHRVHHAKNVRYLDTNYCSITLFWDWVFGTRQPLRDDEPVEYGISRPVDTGSFWDVHFREFVLLLRDIRAAELWTDKLRFLLMPPGWRPGDPSGTAAARKAALATSEIGPG